jgi:hypothetical protein
MLVVATLSSGGMIEIGGVGAQRRVAVLCCREKREERRG